MSNSIPAFPDAWSIRKVKGKDISIVASWALLAMSGGESQKHAIIEDLGMNFMHIPAVMGLNARRPVFYAAYSVFERHYYLVLTVDPKIFNTQTPWVGVWQTNLRYFFQVKHAESIMVNVHNDDVTVIEILNSHGFTNAVPDSMSKELKELINYDPSQENALLLICTKENFLKCALTGQ